jgi:hypothetical protein
MEGVRAAMKTKPLEADQWLNRKEFFWVPRNGDGCYKTGKIDRKIPMSLLGIRTRDLLACSAEPQPTSLPFAPK